jgi:hypothetical protein
MDIPIVPVFSSTAFVGIAAIFILIIIEGVVEVDVAISMSIFCQIVQLERKDGSWIQRVYRRRLRL